MAIEIRTAQASDLTVLKKFEQGIITAERPFDPTLDKDPISYYDLAELIESDKVEVVVAQDEDKLVGSGYAKILPAKPYLDHDEYVYLGFMFVSSDYRGRGINQLLMDALIAWADLKEIKEIRLDVYYENAPAIRAYEKAGFQKNMIEMRLVR